MDQWKSSLDLIDARFQNIKKHLNINSPPLNTPIIPTNAHVPKPSNLGSSKKPSNVTVRPKPPQTTTTTNNYVNCTSSPVNNTPAASTSTAVNNNNNNTTPTVQGLANEFNTIQENVSSLKSMLGNLTSMLQNAIGQPQESAQCPLN